MVWWVHSMCGKSTQFAAGVDPNARGAVCKWCNVALGSWSQG